MSNAALYRLFLMLNGSTNGLAIRLEKSMHLSRIRLKKCNDIDLFARKSVIVLIYSLGKM